MLPRPTGRPKDIHGRCVRLGARLRVLRISPWLLARLDAQEKRRVRSMVGQVFAVDEIDEWGRPWVVKWFPWDTCHSIALDASEMELVPPNPKGRRVRRSLVAKPYRPQTRWPASDSSADERFA